MELFEKSEKLIRITSGCFIASTVLTTRFDYAQLLNCLTQDSGSCPLCSKDTPSSLKASRSTISANIVSDIWTKSQKTHKPHPQLTHRPLAEVHTTHPTPLAASFPLHGPAAVLGPTFSAGRFPHPPGRLLPDARARQTGKPLHRRPPWVHATSAAHPSCKVLTCWWLLSANSSGLGSLLSFRSGEKKGPFINSSFCDCCNYGVMSVDHHPVRSKRNVAEKR